MLSARQQSLIEAFEGLAIALKIIQVEIQFYFPLLTAHCLLLTAYCSPLTAHRSLLTAHCSRHLE
jgi:hypothetical protein